MPLSYYSPSSLHPALRTTNVISRMAHNTQILSLNHAIKSKATIPCAAEYRTAIRAEPMVSVSTAWTMKLIQGRITCGGEMDARIRLGVAPTV
jgi:hypothetical protein